MDIASLLLSIQNLVEMLTVIVRVLCWVDDALGLNIIPDSICTSVSGD